MVDANIYKNIEARTDGNIYIGVVGPVRTGKSTFISKFMDALVLPHIDDEYVAKRALDELPQSSAGRTIMTTEPKFIPEDAVRIELPNNAHFNVRMIDCVGYIVPSSLGYIENEMPRMVHTPWYEEEIPFNMAAELGTQKVISEHSTIGLLITTDGSISDIPREEYMEAEERVVSELREIKKPFIIVLNCMYPRSDSAITLAKELTEKYCVPVVPVNCLELTEEQIRFILAQILFEFPVKCISLKLPGWVRTLPHDHPISVGIFTAVKELSQDLKRVRDINAFAQNLQNTEYISQTIVTSVDLSNGTATVEGKMSNALFYKIIEEQTGIEINSEKELMCTLISLSETKKRFMRIQSALEEVQATGYGIVMPTIDELTLNEPEIMKQGGRYGVRLSAAAPSIHMIRADITTEVAPLVGSESQSEELVTYLLKEFEENPKKIWESDIFGKSLNELVNEGLRSKLYHMPSDARMKLQETLERVINEGCSGLICIIL